jgi:transcriptional regulator with XRE-family HTH domain
MAWSDDRSEDAILANAPDGMTPAAFRAWRRRLGLTQAEAAAALGLGRRLVQYYELGVRAGRPAPVPRTVRLACAALALGIADWDGEGDLSPRTDVP